MRVCPNKSRREQGDGQKIEQKSVLTDSTPSMRKLCRWGSGGQQQRDRLSGPCWLTSTEVKKTGEEQTRSDNRKGQN